MVSVNHSPRQSGISYHHFLKTKLTEQQNNRGIWLLVKVVPHKNGLEPIKDVKWWKSFVGSVGGIYTCNMSSCLESLLVAVLKLRIQIHKCSWPTLIATDGQIMMCLVHHVYYFLSSNVIGTKVNFWKQFPPRILTLRSITRPDLIKSTFASLNYCSRLFTVVHFNLGSSMETFAPACSHSGCCVRNFFQTESILNALSYFVPRTAVPINCLISLPCNSPPLPTWLTSVCKETTSIRTSGIIGAGPRFIELSPVLPWRTAL